MLMLAERRKSRQQAEDAPKVPTLAICLHQVYMAVNAFYATQPASMAMDRGMVNNLNLMRKSAYDSRVSRWTVLSIGCQVIERSPAGADLQVQAAIVAARKALIAYNV